MTFLRFGLAICTSALVFACSGKSGSVDDDASGASGASGDDGGSSGDNDTNGNKSTAASCAGGAGRDGDVQKCALGRQRDQPHLRPRGSEQLLRVLQVPAGLRLPRRRRKRRGDPERLRHRSASARRRDLRLPGRHQRQRRPTPSTRDDDPPKNHDVDFFDAMLSSLEGDYSVDPKAVFITGMSGGAYFVNQLGRWRATEIWGEAPMSGGGPFGNGDSDFSDGNITVNGQVPALIIHGDADGVVDISEGKKSLSYWRGSGQLYNRRGRGLRQPVPAASRLHRARRVVRDPEDGPHHLAQRTGGRVVLLHRAANRARVAQPRRRSRLSDPTCDPSPRSIDGCARQPTTSRINA